jgi:hypothetical protein
MKFVTVHFWSSLLYLFWNYLLLKSKIVKQKIVLVHCICIQNIKSE